MEIVMMNKFLKNIIIGCALISYAASSVAMEKIMPSVKQVDVTKLLGTAAEYGFDAFNFALANGRFLYKGVNILQAWYKKDNPNAVSLDKIDTLPYLSPEVKDSIKSAASKMQMSPNTLVALELSDVGSAASAFKNTIWIDPNIFPLYASDEQEAVVGHECSHLIHKDALKTAVMNLAAPVISYALIKGYEYTANALLEHINVKFSNDGISKVINSFKLINNIVGVHFLPRYLLNLYMVNKVSRSHETRADAESALKLKNPQGLINFFNKTVAPEIVQKEQEIGKAVSVEIKKQYSYIQQILLALRQADETLGMPTHPSKQERIKALEVIKQQLNQ